MRYFGFSAIALAVAMSTASVQADTLTADGVTYSLTDQVVNSTTDQFTLTITGINGSSDTEQGRNGVQSFAFTLPSNYSTATAPAGFTLQAGGLNSKGCSGSGNFFCFAANTTPSGAPLAANSTLSFTFDVSLSSGSFVGYDPDFKINWDGTQNNYDLVSQSLAPSAATPLPASWTMMLTGLAVCFGFIFYQRAKRVKGAAIPAAA
jgi:hypothetical protein